MVNRQIWKRILAGMLLTLLSSPNGLAQEKALPSNVATQTSNGPREEAQVHGHWTVVVRNPDGSIASHHEFENSLQNGGHLNELLSHQATAPVWWIYLKFSGMNSILFLTPNASEGGIPTLAVFVPSSGVNKGKLVLTGSVPGTFSGGALLSGQLLFASTMLKVTCAANATCDGQNAFTYRDLTTATPPDTTAPPAITVQPGQGIDVTVVIGFQ